MRREIKISAFKMQFVCIFFHICWISAEIWIFNFSRYCSKIPKVKWAMLYRCCSKFHKLSSVPKVWKSAKIWQSYREFQGGNFFETQCVCCVTCVFHVCTKLQCMCASRTISLCMKFKMWWSSVKQSGVWYFRARVRLHGVEATDSTSAFYDESTSAVTA